MFLCYFRCVFFSLNILRRNKKMRQSKGTKSFQGLMEPMSRMTMDFEGRYMDSQGRLVDPSYYGSRRFKANHADWNGAEIFANQSERRMYERDPYGSRMDYFGRPWNPDDYESRLNLYTDMNWDFYDNFER